MWDMALFIIVVTGGLTYLFIYSFKESPSFWIAFAGMIAMIAIPVNLFPVLIDEAKTVEEARNWLIIGIVTIIASGIVGIRWFIKAEPKIKQRFEERKQQKELEQKESIEHKNH